MAPPRKPPRRSGRSEAPEAPARVRESLRPPQRITVSRWAEENRILGDESAEPGPWRFYRVPYLREIHDAVTDPEVEVIILCFAAQCGKTELLLNSLGYFIDQDPGPTLIVYPTEQTVKKFFRTRLHPLILQSPAVRRHFKGNSDHLGLLEVALDRMRIWAAWSNSPATLASSPCRYVLLDEVDKFPPYSGKEANPIELAGVRTRTFAGRRKIFVPSTPTLDTGYTWQEFLASDQCYYHVPCLRCGRYQILDFTRIRWPKGAQADEVLTKKLAWYECAHCGGRIENTERREMVARGRWAPKGMTVNALGELEGERPPRQRRGFQLSVLYSPWTSLHEIAWKFLRSYGDPSLLQNFRNAWLGLPWTERVESVTEARIRRAQRDYAASTAPVDAQILTAGVDVQGDCMWYAIRAWGARERSWLVEAGVVFSWEDLERVLLKQYLIGGQPTAILRAGVDSGFRSDEVYRFTARLRPTTWPTKGGHPGQVRDWKRSDPATGVILFTTNPDFFKDRLSAFLGRKPGEDGEWQIHREIDDEYVRQLTSERRVTVRPKRGRPYSTWEPLTESTPNHLWDCEVINLAIAEIFRIRYLDDGAAPASMPAGGERRSESRDEDGGPGPHRGEKDWLSQSGDWLSGGGAGWLG